jgi:hypothetical protein
MLEAFTLMSASRSYGFSSANPIGLLEMIAMYSIDESLWFIDRLALIRIWRRLDDICLIHWAKERDEKAKQKPKPLPDTAP